MFVAFLVPKCPSKRQLTINGLHSDISQKTSLSEPQFLPIIYLFHKSFLLYAFFRVPFDRKANCKVLAK
jgi:hypothetical protein